MIIKFIRKKGTENYNLKIRKISEESRKNVYRGISMNKACIEGNREEQMHEE